MKSFLLALLGIVQMWSAAAELPLLRARQSGSNAPALQRPADCFQRGNEAYEAGNHLEAVACYDTALDAAYSASLYYNRGNAYFKLGQVGKAIADYSRAYALNPHDRDTRHNLAFARAYRPDKVLTLESPLLKILTGFLRLPPLGLARLLAGILFLLAAASLAAMLVLGRRVFGWIAAGPGVLFLYFLAASLSWAGEVNPGRAVVIVPELTLRSGPGPDYKEIAVVHDGLEAAIRERRPGYVLLQIPGGEGGWAEAAAVERVFPGR